MAGSIRVITCNVRFDGQSDRPVPIPEHGTIQAARGWLEKAWGERPWAERRSRLVDAIASFEPDVIGFQEVLHSQLYDLQRLLGPHWRYYGVGRNDGREKGEYSPIFYNSLRFDLVRSQTKWLSLSPDQPGSVGWDAAQTRIATFVTLRDRLAFSTESHGKNDRIHIVNTHYDDQGKRARQESSLLIRAETRKWTDAGPDKDGGPGQQSGLILLGDLNSPEDEKGYKELVSLDPLRYKIPFLSFQDTYLHLLARGDPSLIDGGMAPGGSLSHGTILQSAPAGPRGTFTDFASPGQEADERIDVVMIALQDSAVIDSERDNAVTGDEIIPSTPKARGSMRPTKYVVVDNLLAGRGDVSGWTGRWSDHRAVMVEFSLDG